MDGVDVKPPVAFECCCGYRTTGDSDKAHILAMIRHEGQCADRETLPSETRRILLDSLILQLKDAS